MRFEARTAHAAASLAVEAAQSSLSCVSQAVIVLNRRNLGHYGLTIGGSDVARTTGSYQIAVFEDYFPSPGAAGAIVERVAYRYRVITRDQELLVHHWNPGGPEAKPFPHLHLSAAAEVGNRALTRAHIPTGEVTLRDVVRLLVEELGVRPRRTDWRQVLASPPVAPNE